jgi:Cytochrome C assembly protein
MRRFILACVLSLVSSVLALRNAAAEEGFAWELWRHLPVLDGGRAKPLDSLAWETFRSNSNSVRIIDPASGQQLDAATLYLVTLLEWQGWSDAAPSGRSDSAEGADYFAAHRPDKWDTTPLLRVDNVDLRLALKWDPRQKLVSPLEVHQAKLVVPSTGKESSLLRWAQELGKQEEPLTRLEQDAAQLANRFRSYTDHRMGKRLFIVPTSANDGETWMSAAALLTTTFDDVSDPTGLLREAQRALRAVRVAFLEGSADQFNAASTTFRQTAAKIASGLASHPEQSTIDLEVAYNDWAPFRIAWVLTLLSFVSLLLAMGTRWRAFYAAGWLTFAAGAMALVAGFAMRVMISGRAPVTNMYESVIFVGAGVALLGMVLEAVCRKKFVLTAAAAVATVALVLADNSPVVLDASIAPLQPVLRNNFWLVTHVMTITLSYAALALALGIGNITLGYFLCGSASKSAIDNLTQFDSGRRVAAHRVYHPWRRVGRLFMGTILGLGPQGSLGARGAARLPGDAACPIRRLGRPVWTGRVVGGLFLARRHGVVRRELRAWSWPSQLWFWR